MNAPRHIADRSLPVLGRCAFVRAAQAMAVATLSEPYPFGFQRAYRSFGEKDRMHPGKGGA